MRTDSKYAMPSVKLFPRLAMAKRTRVQPPHRVVDRRLTAATGADSGDARRRQVRARLLRMILDSEEARRNDRRPNAS
ncbi:MAG: hypothetical protein L0228_05485 [Planctomycetes bacterium]|nr:hypothetical protein [Planctomycetota bacterium]